MTHAEPVGRAPRFPVSPRSSGIGPRATFTRSRSASVIVMVGLRVVSRHAADFPTGSGPHPPRRFPALGRLPGQRSGPGQARARSCPSPAF
jgi:hypothetical protein